MSLIAFTRSVLGGMAADPLADVRGAQDDGIRSDSNCCRRIESGVKHMGLIV